MVWTLIGRLYIKLTKYWKDLEFWYTIMHGGFGKFSRVTWNFVRCRQKLILIDEIIIIEVDLIEQHIVKLYSDFILAALI